MRFTLILLTICIITSSCSQEEVIELRTDADNVVVEKPYRWSASLSDGELISGGIQPSLNWNSYVLFGGWLDGSQVLHMKNSEDGSTLWQWSDHLREGERLDIRPPDQHASE